MIDIANKKVAEVVTDNIKTAHIFKKYGIDFCCGGGISIEEACKKKNINPDGLIDDLMSVDEHVSKANDYNHWDLDFLIDHILNIHHSYVLESLPIMIEYAHKVAKVHGHHYTEVIEINDLVRDISNELFAHLQKEENILFPYIKQLVQAKKQGEKIANPPFGSAANPIQMMEIEHEKVGDVFKRIRLLSNQFSPPSEACNTFKALYSILNEFEQDLHQHIHLENNILFPKAIKLEEDIST